MLRDRWSLPALIREATRNVFSLRSRVYPVLLLAALASTATPLVAAQQSLDLTATLGAEALAGRNTVRVTSSDAQNPAEIALASCEELARQPDVDSAGAVVQLGSFDLPQFGSNIPLVGASVTLIPELADSGAVVGPSLRSEASSPDSLLAPDGSVLSASRGHLMASSVGTNNAVAVAIPPEQDWVPACVIVLDDLADPDAVVPRLTASLISRGGALAAVEEFRSPTSPIETYRRSPAALLPYLLGFAGGAAGAVIMFARSSEWAVYRLSGTSRRSLVVLMTMEQVLCALVFLGGSAVTTLGLTGALVSATATLLSAAAGAAIWCGVAFTGACFLSLRSPLAMAKEN